MNRRLLAPVVPLALAAALAVVPRQLRASAVYAPPNATIAIGTLPLANLAQGTADQILGENHAGTAPAYFTAGGDVSLASGSFTVNQIAGASPINITTASTVQWAKGVAAPTITQATQTTDVAPPNLTLQPGAPWASAVTNLTPGAVVVNEPSPASGTNYSAFTVRQNGTNTAMTGVLPSNTAYGCVWLGNIAVGSQVLGNATICDNAGSNTYLNASSGGNVFLAVNGTSVETLTSAAITLVQPATASSTLTSTGAFTASTTAALTGAITHPSPQTIACGTGGTQTVAASPSSGLIVTSGTLSSNCTIDFGTNATSGDFTLDMGGVTLGASFGVIFKNGTSSSATFLSGSVIGTGATLAKVWTHGANTLAVQW